MKNVIYNKGPAQRGPDTITLAGQELHLLGIFHHVGPKLDL